MAESHGGKFRAHDHVTSKLPTLMDQKIWEVTYQ